MIIIVRAKICVLIQQQNISRHDKSSQGQTKTPNCFFAKNTVEISVNPTKTTLARSGNSNSTIVPVMQPRLHFLCWTPVQDLICTSYMSQFFDVSCLLWLYFCNSQESQVACCIAVFDTCNCCHGTTWMLPCCHGTAWMH